MRLAATGFAVALNLPAALVAQHPLHHFSDAIEIRFARTQPVVAYTLRVDSADLSAFTVEMRLRNLPDTFRLAMAKHPEYDDRYWRFVDGLRVEGKGGTAATVVREDSALWHVVAPGGEAVVRYRIKLPPALQSARAAWRPFLAPTGGLVGGPHAFMYVVGAELAPSHVAVELPAGWEIATALEPTSDPRTFFAPSVDVLVESPILVGRLRSWRFAVDGVPHRVVYWPLPSAAPFDTSTLVGSIEKLAREAVAVFGRAPWREYTFLLQDAAYGALEHPSSVTLGAPSASLAANPNELLGEIAHEFFHAWNLMRIRPIEYRGVDYRPMQPSGGLWFSEGLSMFYSDLLRRRAGLPTGQPTRAEHVASIVASYLSVSGNTRFSAEQVSRVAYNATPDAFGDYDASTHVQGEVLGTILDLVIRDATNGRRSMDDVMRLMLERYSGERGFTGRDIERAVADVCGCSVAAIFDAHVRGATPIDVDRYLRLAGLRARITREPATTRTGQPAPDLRLVAWQPPGDPSLRLKILDPASVWGRAGLHTSDRLVRVNGASFATWPELRATLARLRIGDTVHVEVARRAGPYAATIVMTGYDRPAVRIEELPDANEKQRAIRAKWEAGAP